MNSAKTLAAAVALALAVVISAPASPVSAGEWTRFDRQAARRAAVSNWHGTHYNTQTGRPTAAVVPPTAHMQSNYSWGVAQTRSNPVYHQYGRAYPGQAAPAGLPYSPTPRWPSSTEQSGYYHVRGPW